LDYLKYPKVLSMDFHWLLSFRCWNFLIHYELNTKVVAFVNLSMKVVCFVLYLWDPPNQDVLDHVLDVFAKFSTRRGAWFHDIWTCGAKVIEYWMMSSLKFKFNHSWNLWKNWNVPLVLLERSWWTWFNGIYLVRFGFKMWEIFILSGFCCWKFK